MSFQAIIQADTLQDALDPVSQLVQECKIHLDQTGFGIRAVDPANVAMVDLSLDAGAFESYEAGGELIGVNLNRLTTVVGFADSDELVHLGFDAQTRKLHIETAGLEYTLALIDPDTIREEPDLPDLDLPATIVIEGRDIDRAVTAADMVADHVTFAAGGDGNGIFHATADGDTDDMELALDDEDILDAPQDPSERVSSLFSLDYLDDMVTGNPSDAEVSILLGNQMPAKLQWSAVDDNLGVTFMLAPRIGGGS